MVFSLAYGTPCLFTPLDLQLWTRCWWLYSSFQWDVLLTLQFKNLQLHSLTGLESLVKCWIIYWGFTCVASDIRCAKSLSCWTQSSQFTRRNNLCNRRLNSKVWWFTDKESCKEWAGTVSSKVHSAKHARASILPHFAEVTRRGRPETHQWSGPSMDVWTFLSRETRKLLPRHYASRRVFPLTTAVCLLDPLPVPSALISHFAVGDLLFRK